VIAVSIVGALSFIAIVCGAIALYRSFKRKTNTYHISNYGADGPSHGPGGVFVTRTRSSWGWGPLTRKNAGNRESTPFDSVGLPGDDDKKTGDFLRARVVLPITTSHAIPAYKPPFDTPGRTGSPQPAQKPHRNFSLPLESSPSTDGSLSEKQEDPSVAYGVPTTDEKPPLLSDVPSPSSSDAHFNEPEQHARSPHVYTKPLEAV